MIQRILGVDFGTKSIGLAVGDTLIHSVVPLGAIPASNGIPSWTALKAMIQPWAICSAVIGLPLNMDGSEQPLTGRVRKFADQLYDALKVSAVFHDERLSTVDARSRIFEAQGYRGLSKKNIDALSAALILEGWFESQSFTSQTATLNEN